MLRTVLTLLIASVGLSASTIGFTTAGSAVNGTGQAVSASGSIAINSNGIVTVTLSDTLSNPTDAGQLLTDLFFTLDAAPITVPFPTTTPFGANLINIASGGAATADTVDGFASWGLSSSGTTIHLDSLVGGPSQALIGPGGTGGVYTNANGSIAANSSDNPFITGTATFMFFVDGVTANTAISAPVFSFGTAAGDNVAGCLVGGPSCTSSPVPEPVTSGLVGMGLVSVFFLRRRVNR